MRRFSRVFACVGIAIGTTEAIFVNIVMSARTHPICIGMIRTGQERRLAVDLFGTFGNEESCISRNEQQTGKNVQHAQETIGKL
jgi:hypothetical protein